MSSTVLELYLSKRVCGCSGESYVQTAHDESLLFTLSDSSFFTRGIDRVLRDAHSGAPLLHAKSKGKRIDVYKGESKEAGELVFTVVKVSSFFSSRTLNIFLAGSSLNGPPDYKLKPSTFRNPLKIFRQEEEVAKANENLCMLCVCCKPDYIITISPGMDQAMVVLLIAIHEDLRPKQNGSHAASGGMGGGGGGGGCGGGGG